MSAFLSLNEFHELSLRVTVRKTVRCISRVTSNSDLMTTTKYILHYTNSFSEKWFSWI